MFPTWPTSVWIWGWQLLPICWYPTTRGLIIWNTATHKNSPTDTCSNTVILECSSFSRDHYFTAVTWLVHHHVAAVIWMNRVQNISIISLCQGPLWNCKLVSTMVFYSAWYQSILLVSYLLCQYTSNYYSYLSPGKLFTT